MCQMVYGAVTLPRKVEVIGVSNRAESPRVMPGKALSTDTATRPSTRDTADEFGLRRV